MFSLCFLKIFEYSRFCFHDRPRPSFSPSVSPLTSLPAPLGTLVAFFWNPWASSWPPLAPLRPPLGAPGAPFCFPWALQAHPSAPLGLPLTTFASPSPPQPPQDSHQTPPRPSKRISDTPPTIPQTLQNAFQITKNTTPNPCRAHATVASLSSSPGRRHPAVGLVNSYCHICTYTHSCLYSTDMC